MKKVAAAAASPSTSETRTLPADLIQIEEPAPPARQTDTLALSVGLELGQDALFLAVSIGGNGELIRGADGSAGLLPAITGYDSDGNLVAGLDGLADASRIGDGSLHPIDAVDARGADLRTRLDCLMVSARRQLARLFDQPVGGAVLAVAPDMAPDARMLLMGVIDESGMEILRIVDAEDAAALAQFGAATAGMAAIGAALIAEEMLRG